MSGGSWEYLYRDIEEAANRLKNERETYRQAFGDHMKKLAKAMYAIEWADSGDSSEEEAKQAIMQVISPRDVLDKSLAEAHKISEELIELIEACERV